MRTTHHLYFANRKRRASRRCEYACDTLSDACDSPCTRTACIEMFLVWASFLFLFFSTPKTPSSRPWTTTTRRRRRRRRTTTMLATQLWQPWWRRAPCAFWTLVLLFFSPVLSKLMPVYFLDACRGNAPQVCSEHFSTSK